MIGRTEGSPPPCSTTGASFKAGPSGKRAGTRDNAVHMALGDMWRPPRAGVRGLMTSKSASSSSAVGLRKAEGRPHVSTHTRFQTCLMNWTHGLTSAVPPTPALGFHISPKAMPNAQGTMALYLAKGGGSDRPLGLSCRHVLIGSKEANVNYVHHPGGCPKDILLLGKSAFICSQSSIFSLDPFPLPPLLTFPSSLFAAARRFIARPLAITIRVTEKKRAEIGTVLINPCQYRCHVNARGSTR
ncbi:hypothetical protein F5148DRAFT_460737 [Russula earlei]|uniref:Uncharacterized protein n=1 Tax=Russula earlei TaxID=71964 RepID=A0ACC0TYH0_9AGAM|nr:hypothetical protein F5148DRAFT_460737 [Russula earlei]